MVIAVDRARVLRAGLRLRRGLAPEQNSACVTRVKTVFTNFLNRVSGV